MKKKIYNFPHKVLFCLIISAGILYAYPDGVKTYQELNADPNNPFALSIGTSISQTKYLNNTVNPKKFIRQKLQQLIKPLSIPKAITWLKDKDRYWFTLNALPTYVCKKEHVINPIIIGIDKHSIETQRIFANLAENKNTDQLTLTKCPYCQAEIIKENAHTDPVWTDRHEDALLSQLEYLGVFGQKGVHGKIPLPTYRLSLEAADILQPDSDKIDENKLKEQANFITRLVNPLLFMHHYSNPLAKAKLFENSKDIDWFVNYCGSILKHSPQITHVCPISQPIAFSFRPRRQGLPPFECTIKQDKFLENITHAQISAAKRMKTIRKNMQKGSPKLNVLLSHQWKLMKPKHTNSLDPRNFLELQIASIAHKMYNQKFVDLVTPYLDDFDGIALSLYPPVYFNLVTPEADNCSGIIDEVSALETVQAAHKAFPTKDIYIVETGCNTDDPRAKIDFINMTLNVCKVARAEGIPVKAVYFWGHTNDPEFYFEWNAAPGSTYFGPFDRLDITDPLNSINMAGIYIKHILNPLKG